MVVILVLAHLVFGALCPQDDLARKIEEALPRLADDSIEVRDRAVQSLVDLGPAAIPLLRKRAAELGGETRGRLLEACGRIESLNTLARFLPPLRKVTLDWDNRPAKDAFEEIARRAGFAVDSSGASLEGSISLALRDATPLAALDEACRRAGVSWRSGEVDFFMGRRRRAVTGEPARLILQNSRPVDYPSAYVRQYRFQATQVSLTRTNTFQASQSSAQMNLDLSWSPGVRPDGLNSFKVAEIKDDQGRSLLIEENEAGRARFRGMRGRWHGRDMGSFSQVLAFKFPEADARSLSVVRGTAVLSFPQELKTITFENPAQAGGKSIELSGLTIALQDFQEKGNGISLTLVMTGRYRAPAGAEDEEADAFGALPFSYEDVEVVTQSGDSLQHQGMSGRGDGNTYTWQLEFTGVKASAAKEVRISCVLRHHFDEAEFVIKDIALPR